MFFLIPPWVSAPEWGLEAGTGKQGSKGADIGVPAKKIQKSKINRHPIRIVR